MLTHGFLIQQWSQLEQSTIVFSCRDAAGRRRTALHICSPAAAARHVVTAIEHTRTLHGQSYTSKGV